MKRKVPRYRVMPFPAVPAIPDTTQDALGHRFPLAPEQSGLRARRIFVIERVSVLPATNTRVKTIRRILIFDDHPASLRLVFARRTSPQAGWTTTPSEKWWEFPLGCMLILGVLIIVFLPLFLRLPS
jgi:hypothetical protein